MTAACEGVSENPSEISFIYDWKVGITRPLTVFNVFGDADTFCTSFRCGSPEWVVHLSSTNTVTNKSPRIILYLEHNRVMASHVSPKKCKFSFRLDDGNSNMTDHPITSITAMRVTTQFSSMDSFRIPKDSGFTKELTKCFTDPNNTGKAVIITTDLLFDVNAFSPSINNWLGIVPKPPSDTSNDFRFKILKPDAADFTLHCRDGDVMTSKTALFLSSDYFRSKFTANDDGLRSVEHSLPNYSTHSIQQVLIFIITGTLEVPSDLIPSIAKELIDAMAFFKPLNRDGLRNTVHKALCEYVAKNYTDLNAIVELLALSNETNLSQLKQMCMSIIVSEHYYLFKHNYTEEASNPVHRTLYDRIRWGGFLMTISPISRINTMWRQSHKCRTIFRYGAVQRSLHQDQGIESTSNDAWNELD